MSRMDRVIVRTVEYADEQFEVRLDLGSLLFLYERARQSEKGVASEACGSLKIVHVRKQPPERTVEK